jgi:hypothetical protein
MNLDSESTEDLMHQSKLRIVADGVMAGLLGGLIIALWFLIFDAVNGHPLQTPELLAAALLHGSRAPVPLTSTAWTLVAEYTVAHFLVFAALGAIGALLIDGAERHPELFGTLMIFTIAFEVFFIALVMLAGPAAAAAMPWWKIIAGNLMATAGMLAFFLWRQPGLAQNMMGEWTAVVREGVVSGIIGGIIVAVWFLIYDLVSGHPFHTPALLGAIVFNALHQPESVAVSTAVVLGYTVLHFFAFIMFGIASSILMVASEREPVLALGELVLFVWFELCFVAFVTFLDNTAVQEIGWWNIIGGNIAALAAIIAYFEHGHPRIVGRIIDRWEGLRDEAATQRTTAR